MPATPTIITAHYSLLFQAIHDDLRKTQNLTDKYKPDTEFNYTDGTFKGLFVLRLII
jgi:hypothetical protein